MKRPSRTYFLNRDMTPLWPWMGKKPRGADMPLNIVMISIVAVRLVFSVVNRAAWGPFRMVLAIFARSVFLM